MTDKIVFEITRLQFYTIQYIWENEHKGRHIIKKGSGRHEREQQRHLDIKRRVMVKKTNDDRNNSITKELGGRRNHFIGGNMMKWY